MLLIENNLALHYLSILRDKNTGSAEFNIAMNRLSEICAIHILQDFAVQEITIQTPLEETQGIDLLSEDIVLLPVLRAGMGLYSGFHRYLPKAQSAFIAQQRNEETGEAMQSYASLPSNTENKFFFILDPMLATGGSLCNVIDTLKQKNIPEERIILITIVASPQGIDFIKNKYPDITGFTVSVDRELNEKHFILPGLGDAGDRLFNTQD